MNPSTFKGHVTALVRRDKTRTGVCLGQDENSGECYAVCGTCFHLIHATESTWRCSDRECKIEFPTVKLSNSSIFDTYRFSTPDGASQFVTWVQHWTGLIPSAEFTVNIEFD